MQTVLLDTCTVIHIYQNKNVVLKLLDNYKQSQFAISIFTYAEFVAKVPFRQKKDARKFLQVFKVVDITASFKEKLFQHCMSYEVPKKQLIDFFIASTALQQGFTFVTENAKDFKKYTPLKLVTYNLGFFD